MEASIGPNSTADDRTQGCQVYATLTYPAGYAFFVDQVHLEGTARLDPGVSAIISSTVYFNTGLDISATAKTIVSGRADPAVEQGFDTYEAISSEHPPVSQCGNVDGKGASLDINTRVALFTVDTSATGELGHGGSGTADEDVTAHYRFQWIKC
jgi:hypothetical protein